jgi:hypothetical protein
MGLLMGGMAALIDGTRHGWNFDAWSYAALWGGIWFVTQTGMALFRVASRQGNA